MGVNSYTSLPLALTANLINEFLHLFLHTGKLRFNYLSILAAHLQNGRYEIHHILHDELELLKEV